MARRRTRTQALGTDETIDPNEPSAPTNDRTAGRLPGDAPDTVKQVVTKRTFERKTRKMVRESINTMEDAFALGAGRRASVTRSGGLQERARASIKRRFVEREA